MRTSWLVGTAIGVLLLVTFSGQCRAEFRQAEELVIEKNEVINDEVYLAGNSVIVNGTINGDLIVAGGQVTFNGTIDGDLIAAAARVVVNGKVSDDTRIAGQVLIIQDEADIGDDLIAAGYSLECTPASRVGGEVAFAGYQSVLAGRVEGKVTLASTNCQLSGSFGHDVDAIVEGGDVAAAGYWGADIQTISQGLTVTESADIAGDLSYQSSREAAIDSESTIAGEVEHSQTDSDEAQRPTIVERVAAVVKQFLALLFVGLLVVYVCPKWTERVANNIQRQPLASLGWGALTLIAAIFGAILLLVVTIAFAVLLGLISMENLILIWLGVVSLITAAVVVASYIGFAWIAKVVVSIWAGNRIINGRDWIAKRRLFVLALGVTIFVALTWIPIFGSAFSLVVMLMGAGSVVILVFNELAAWFTANKLGDKPS